MAQKGVVLEVRVPREVAHKYSETANKQRPHASYFDFVHKIYIMFPCRVLWGSLRNLDVEIGIYADVGI